MLEGVSEGERAGRPERAQGPDGRGSWGPFLGLWLLSWVRWEPGECSEQRKHPI